MSNPAIPPVTGSAARHAQRIRERDAQKAKGEQAPAKGQSTAEMYASRALAAHQADEELREGARLRELQARGIISAAEDVEEEVGDEEEFEEEDLEDEEEEPLSTAERYAAIERKRREAEHQANLAAHRGAVRTTGPLGHRHAAQLAQPHRKAHLWQKPAS